ncbi:MAG: GntR family transcriptional regulator, partial [Anaerolineaceae bacterium]
MSIAINKQTLSEQIYLILRQDILTQQIKCGQKLTLQSLKDRFGVSHTPIREALTRLVDDDLVIYYSNVGVSVIN